MFTQLVMVGTGEGILNSVWHTYGIMERYAPQLIPAMRAARQQQGKLDFRTLNFIHIPIAIASMLMLPFVARRCLRDPAFRDIGMLATAVGVALLANAAICGILSNPHDRYGSRLVWIAPLVLIVAALRHLAARQNAAA
jgi:DNA-binding transcriptional LysR family regulator